MSFFNRIFLLLLILGIGFQNQVIAQQTQQGPWNSPLRIATSTDGINFTSSNIFQDSSGVPHVIRWKGDTLICVFQWFRKPNPSPTWDRVAVKFSYNKGIDWTNPVPLNFLNFPSDYQRPFDPTVVTFGKDSLRIYYSSGLGTSQGGLTAAVNTYSAVSGDGLNFYFESGARVDEAAKQVIDPALAWFKNQWHFTAPKGAPQDGALHYTSADGLTFKAEPVIPSDNNHNWTGNLMVDLTGKLRFYGSGNKLWYSNSSDGFSWSAFTDTNINGGDPSVLQLETNRFLMIYVGEQYSSVTSQIPTITTSTISNLGSTTATSGGNVSADGGSTVTARGVVWSTNPTPVISLSTKTSNGSGTGTFSSSLTSLSPNTTYYVRAYATNSAGTAYGNEISFKTNNTVTSSNLTSSTSISIKKTWSQQPNGYNYPMNIFVPTGAVPQGGFPVCILLHGNGGNGPGMVNQFLSTLSCHILVAPSGYQNSWNICAENSDAPDVEMIQDLVNNLQGYTNVNPNKIRILGSSNGAGLANRVFIENTNPGIDIICAIVSHLNEPQYHSGNFYKPGNTTDPSGSFCGYNVLATPLKSRKYLSISNDNDNLIPYLGGTSVVGVSFLAAETASLTIAKYKGHTNNILATGVTMGDPSITEFSYLSGDVVHLKGNAMHGTNATQRSYIKKYFSDCQASTSVPAILPAGVFEISPNPASDYVDILSMGDMSEKVILQLIGLNGQQLLTKNINGIIAGESIRLPLNHLHSGLYFLRIQTEKGVWVRKLEIMR